MRYWLGTVIFIVNFPFQCFKYILPFPSGLQSFCRKIHCYVWGFPYMLLVASPLLFLIVFLCVQSLLVRLVCVLACFSLGLSCMELFVHLGLDWLLPLSCWGNFQLQKFSPTFSFPLFLWDLYNLNVGVFDMVPQVSETVLNSFHSFYFILLFESYFYHFIFQLTDLIFCFRYSAIDSSRVFLISVIMVSLCTYSLILLAFC